MRDGNVIFDLVVHVHNLLRENLDTPGGRIARPTVYHHQQIYKRGIEELPPYEEFFSRPPDSRAVYDKIFSPGSQIDYAMVQAVPLFDLMAESPERNIARVREMALLDPDRVIFCGATDPVLRGLTGALRDIETQITTMNARSMKFYTAHAFGNSWRMDDRKLAYPMFERMLELGVTLAQVHKGDPQAVEPLVALDPCDVHEAALDFPEMNFIVHHLAFPFEEAAIDLAARLPNVYVAMSTWINLIHVAPVETAMRLGKALVWAGADKVIWGSETPIWPRTQTLLDLSWDFQIPEDLQRGWGFPAITDADRKRMFGATLLELLGMPYAPPPAAAVGVVGIEPAEV
jgi:uncharacterized protein